MNALLIALSACLAVASCGVLQGPGSHAAVLGPDGSQIVSSEAGGVVAASVAHGYSAHALPLVAPLPVARALPLGLPLAHGILAHEGQYVPSGLENLYDDGSYRAEHQISELY